MFILAKRNITLCTVDGDEDFTVHRDFIGEIPDRFCNTPYFRALAKDGKIVIPETHKDKDMVKAADDGEKVLEETVKRTRKPKKGAE